MKKILIVLGLALAFNVNAQIGFTSWDEPVETPTTQELIAELTSQQRAGMVDGFAQRMSVTSVKHTYNIPTPIVAYFYAYFRQINARADELMGENDFTANQLIAAVYAEFSADFSQAQIQYILTKKVNWSNGKGTADWTYYKSQF